MPQKLDSEVINFARVTLKKEKVFTLERLISLLNCSRRTTQTMLSHWKTYTSYNQNSKYYSFPEIPGFDHHGLWWFKDIAFSKHGNLKKTIIHLIGSSESGLTGKELGSLLGLSPKNFVHHFRDCAEICREKRGGVYVHFSAQTSRHKLQTEKRIATLLPVGRDAISESDSIIILVAIIKHYAISPKEILTLAEVNKSGVSELAVQNFLEYHGLKKKIRFPGPEAAQGVCGQVDCKHQG